MMTGPMTTHGMRYEPAPAHLRAWAAVGGPVRVRPVSRHAEGVNPAIAAQTWSCGVLVHLAALGGAPQIEQRDLDRVVVCGVGVGVAAQCPVELEPLASVAGVEYACT